MTEILLLRLLNLNTNLYNIYILIIKLTINTNVKIYFLQTNLRMPEIGGKSILRRTKNQTTFHL